MKNKKLLISALTLVFAVIAVVSTTFAWFTMNSENSIEGMDFSATSGEGLYISATGVDGSFKSDLTLADIKAASTSKGFGANDKLTALTSKDGISLLDYKSIAATAGYVEFKVYFRSQSALKVKLDATKTTILAKGADKSIYLNDIVEDANVWNPANYAANALQINTDTKQATLTTNLANAARFSVTVNTASSSTIYDLNSTKGFGGIEERFADSLSHAYLAKVSATDATNIVEKFGVVDGGAEKVKLDATKTELAPTTTIADTALLTLAQNGDWYTGDFTFRLWIEGFDNDCFDVLFKQALTANFAFKGTSTN